MKILFLFLAITFHWCNPDSCFKSIPHTKANIKRVRVSVWYPGIGNIMPVVTKTYTPIGSEDGKADSVTWNPPSNKHLIVYTIQSGDSVDTYIPFFWISNWSEPLPLQRIIIP